MVTVILFGTAGLCSLALGLFLRSLDKPKRPAPKPQTSEDETAKWVKTTEHDLGIKGHEKDCLLCAQPKPLATLTGYAVLHDSKQREASDRVPVTCEVRPPRQTSPGNVTVDIRIKESPITLIPTRFDDVVWAVVVLDEDATMSIGRSGQMIRRGDVFTITS